MITTPIPFRDRLRRDLPLAAILALAALCYARALGNGILSWDDHWHLTFNTDIRSLHPASVAKLFTSFYADMYHPLTTLSFALEYRAFGLNPAVFHATNVLLHLLNVALLHAFVLLLSGSRRSAIVAAGLFAVHPVHVESVAWITQRKDVLYAAFFFGALICHARHLREGGRRLYWLSLCLFALSLLSKSTAVTLPLALFLLDARLRGRLTRARLAEKLPFLALAAVFGSLALHSQGLSTTNDFLRGLTPADRPFLAAYTLVWYLAHLLLPAGLATLHLMPVKTGGQLPVGYYLAVVPLLALGALLWRRGPLQRDLRFGLLFFAVAILPNVHLVPFGMSIVSERYAYVPFAGLYFIIGRSCALALERHRHLPFVRSRRSHAAALVALACLAAMTHRQVGVWESTQSLFQDAAAKASTEAEARRIRALGYQFDGTAAAMAKDYAAALRLFGRAVESDPTYAENYYNRGMIEMNKGDLQRAWQDLSRVVELDPSSGRAHASRAIVGFRLRRDREACTDLKRAFELGMEQVLPQIQARCR